MSEGNGKTPTLEELREQYRLERAQGKLALARAERQMREAVGGGLNFAWGDYVSPYSFRRDDFGSYWLPSAGQGVGARKDGAELPDFGSDADLDRMRTAARYLARKNDLAIGAVKTFKNYTIKQGFEWDTRPVRGREKDARALLLAQQALGVIRRHDQFNDCKSRERSAFDRAVRDGDVLTRHFAQADGTTVMRFAAAEQLRDPGGRGPHCSFGVETDPEDVEAHRAYWLTYDGTAFDRVPAEECSYLKRNTDEEVKRGVSDFFSAGESFDDVAKLLRNMRKGGGVLAAIAYIEQFENATRDQLGAFNTGQTDLNRPALEHPVTGRQVNYQQFDPGTIIRMNRGKNYLPPPLAANSNNFGLIVQAALRAVGVRWCMPEYMVSGFVGNVAELSILAAGSPFVNNVECEQSDFGQLFLRWRWIAVKNACDAGLIDAPFEEVQALVEIHYTAPPVAVATEADQAAIDHGDMDRGALSLQTRQARRKLDPEQERKNIAEHPMTRQPGRAIDLDAAGNPITAQTQQGGIPRPVPVAGPGVRESFDPSKHPRGGPHNAGQFAPGGGGGRAAGGRALIDAIDRHAAAAAAHVSELAHAEYHLEKHADVPPASAEAWEALEGRLRDADETLGRLASYLDDDGGELREALGGHAHADELLASADGRVGAAAEAVTATTAEAVAAAAIWAEADLDGTEPAAGVAAQTAREFADGFLKDTVSRLEAAQMSMHAIKERLDDSRAEVDESRHGARAVADRLDRIERALVRLLEYSEDQERDYHGRFGSGGAPGERARMRDSSEKG